MDDVFQYIKDNNGIDIELFYFYEVKVVFMKIFFFLYYIGKRVFERLYVGISKCIFSLILFIIYECYNLGMF